MTQTNEQEVINLSSKITDKSEPFIGKWNELISTTNWDKGAIICEWRAAIKKAKGTPAECSDEAWSQLVEGVTPQHVGRLRRTYERFGHVHQEYAGIYWSHFYAALEWDDAEMWLEGAVQSKWSVSRMRRQRWEVLGKNPDQEPDDRDIVATEIKEENQSLELSEKRRQNDRDYVEGPVFEGPDFGDKDPMKGSGKGSKEKRQRDSDESDDDDELDVSEKSSKAGSGVRPFESFNELPEDVDEAANAFKVAIINHRNAEWEEISKDDMLGLLNALKVLVDC